MSNTPYRVDKPLKDNLQVLANSNTINDLYAHAKNWYGLEKDVAREILKSEGYTNFKKDQWFQYLNVLRKHWNHIMDREPEQSKEERLQEQSKNVRMVWDDEDKVYRYTGTEKELEAYWELQDLLRTQNAKRSRRRWQPLNINF